MPGELLYLDSSALVKLVVLEAESAALQEALAQQPQWVSSALAVVEVRRAVRRVSDRPEVLQRVDEVLAGINLLRIDEPILAAAGILDPPLLRSLDAIHLASALTVADQLAGFIVYDPRLADAARRVGLTVVAPGTSP